MKRRTNFLIAICICISAFAYSQDLHFTNYYYSPLYLSPAKTGAFAGTYRFGVNVRDQFNSFIEKPYQSFMAHADMPIAFGFKPHHWIGVGLNMYGDRAGDLSYSNTGAHLSLAYHYAIDPNYKTVITAGIQYGMTQRNINTEGFLSERTILQLSEDDLSRLMDFNPSVGDINFGLSVKNWTSKTSYFDIGGSIYHLSQADFRFTGSSVDNQVRRRINAYAEYHIQSTDQLAIKPIIVYSKMWIFQNLFGQFNLEYRPNKKSATTLKGGLGYRSGDAVQFLAGVIYKGWDIGIAYDFTVSSAADLTNRYGGIELGIRRIIIANKKPTVKPKELCPRL
ncbi:PorP/SprF family type IX secretion system membrane protein [Saprospiraceae bacterium]|nr:PorP/SprF family type IX secretion system membrane protein [Saprospiraceae bacterium]